MKESTPLAVLFSCQLMIVATVHTKEVIIRNVITGDIQLVINELGGSVSEVHCAVLDDRERKIVLGFSNGVISEYNCLNGLRIKSFPPLHGSIKHLLYSPDRVIIAVVGTGDIIVLDDSALDDQGSKNSMLREVKAHEKDITCIAYSHKLGLFATADMFGTLKLWNFQYLTTELVIKNCPSMDIGSLTFLDPFPLLLVADNSSSFSIFPVGRAYSYFQRQFWKLEPFVARQQKKSKGNRSVSSTSNKGDASVGSVSSPTDRKKSVGSISLSNSEENRSASSAQSLFSAGEETDAEDDEDGKQKPFTKKRMRRYLRAKRELKTLVVHQFTTTSQSGNDDKDSDDDETYAWSKLFASSSSDDSPPELKRKSRGRGNDNSSLMSNKRDSTQDNISIESSAPHPLKLLDSMRSGKDLNDGFPAGLKIVAVCGHDDGTIAIFDLTSAIQSIDFPPLQASQEVPRELSYDPRKLVSIRSNVDNSRTIWSNDDLLEGETVEATELETAWLAHRGSINNLTIMGDFRDIVSCGEDHCVNIFSFEGYAKGYLTRSRELDKLIRPRWRNPVDMQRRARLRRREARKLIKDLNLQRSTTKNQFLLDPFSDEDPDVRGAKLKMGLMEVLDPNTSLPIVATDTQLAGTITVSVGLLGDQLQQSHQNLQFTDHSLSKVTGNGKQGEDCERTRILEQFRGKVTYDRSQKEIAKEQAMIAIKKHAEEVENSSLKLRKEKKKAKRRAKVLKGDEPTGAAYLNELMYGGDIKMIKPQRKRRPGELEVSERLLQPVGPRRLKTKYDTEIDQIDQQDPRNWDISSSNRQREFYQRLHIEMDKRGTSKDPMRVIEHKLNTLSPNGDFRAFAQMIKKKRHKARRSLQSRSSASLKNQDVEQANLKSSATMPMATVASPTQTLCLIGTKDLESRTMDGEFADNFVSNVYPDGGNHTSLATKLKQDQPANIVISRNLLENAEQKDCHSGTQKLEEAEGQQNQNLSQEEKLAIENLVSTHKLNIIISNSFSINPELNMTLSAPAPPLTNLFNSPVYEKSKATSPSNQGSSTSPNASTRKNSNKSRNSSPGGGSIKPGKMQRHSFSRSAGEGITERHTQRDSVGRMSFHGLAEISLGSLASSINTRKLDQKHAKLHEHAHTFEHITQKDCEHAMAAQRSTMTALSIFEQEVKKTETLYRRAKLQLKKDKKKAKTLAKSQSLAPISSISIDRNRFTGLSTAASLESLGSNKTPKSNNSSQQKKLGDGPNTRSLPTLRHSTAKMMLKNQSSVEGLLQVGHKKRAVETNIERKIAYTIRAYGLDVGGSKIEGQGNVLARLLEDQKDTKGIVTESLRINKYISRSPMFRNKHRAKSLMNSSRDSIDTGRSYSQDYSTNNSMDEIERQEEMKLRDTYFDYVDDKTTRLNLLHMLNHHTIASRPQYHLALTQLLHHKQCDFFEAGLEIPAQEITATMSEIVHHMEPYMSPAERIQSAKYLRVFVEEEIKSHAAKDNLSIEQVEMLHSLFSFFDKDKSGQIEVAELMAVLKKTTENRIKEESELLLSGAELPLNSGWDVNEDSIVRMIQSVDSDANLELNFEEFLELFKNCLE